MRLALTFIFAFFFHTLAHGQGTVGGKVYGEGHDELAGATVYLLQMRNDSLVQNVLTDDKGCFCFKELTRAAIWSGPLS